MLFDVVGPVGPRNHVLDGRAHQCHLANTVERLCAAAMTGSATRDGDAACSQITLGSRVYSVNERKKQIYTLRGRTTTVRLMKSANRFLRISLYFSTPRTDH